MCSPSRGSGLGDSRRFPRPGPAAGCIYGTAPTCYLGYAARVDGFTVADLDAELYERRSHVRLRCMRGSSYVVPVELAGTVTAGTADVAASAYDRILRNLGVDAAQYSSLAGRVVAAMAGREPMTKAQIRSALGSHAPETQVLSYIVAALARENRLVRATVRGGWRSDSYAYAIWEDWVGRPLAAVDPHAARVDLGRMYLRAYGPATVADLRWWTGWKVAQANAVVENLSDEVVTVDVDGIPMLLLGDEWDALLGAAVDQGRGVRLLPVWDSLLMGWEDRTRFVTESQRPLIYDKAGNGTSVLLVDGRAEGIWELDVDKQGTGLTVRVAPFTKLSKARWSDVEAEAERLATAVSAASLTLERSDHVPAPLADSPARNAFLAPIRLGAR